jgi:hypothetical protein
MVAWAASQNNQLRWLYVAGRATVAVAAGEFADALDVVGREIEEIVQTEGPASQAIRIGFPAAIDAALALTRLADADHLLSLLAERPGGHVPPYVRAQLARGHGLLAGARDDRATAESQLGAAAEGFRSLGFPYWLASAQTDLAALRVDDKRVDEARPLLEEALSMLGRLSAASALQRAEAVLARAANFQLQTGTATGRE